MNMRTPARFFMAAVLLLSCSPTATAGPPFLTDDPETVEYRHWEFYIASQHAESAGGWSGTAPHFELNYGAVPNLQLHLIAPMAYDAPDESGAHYGYGGTELGGKFRFVQETGQCPQIGIFPLLELPSGSASDETGGDHAQTVLPLWLQKSLGDWTIYGGGGYGINPGEGNRNWGFGGLVAQLQIAKQAALGAEIYHRSAMDDGGRDDTIFIIGTVIDFSEHRHLLFSIGRSIDGPTNLQVYAAYQFTGSLWFRR